MGKHSSACLKNGVYDVQCEPPRARWLIDLLTPEQEEELIFRLVAAIPAAKSTKDLYQICNLCYLLAKSGHPLVVSPFVRSCSIVDGGRMAFRRQFR